MITHLGSSFVCTAVPLYSHSQNCGKLRFRSEEVLFTTLGHTGQPVVQCGGRMDFLAEFHRKTLAGL